MGFGPREDGAKVGIRRAPKPAATGLCKCLVRPSGGGGEGRAKPPSPP